MNRREFMKLSGGVAALAAMPALGFGAEETNSAPVAALKKRALKRGIMWGTVPGKLSVMDKFKMIKEAGFDGVEVNGGMDPDEVLKAREATGLLIPSVCNPIHWMKTLTDANPAAREAGVEALKADLRDCKAYGGSSVLLVPGVVNKQTTYAEAYERAQAEIRKAIPLAEELGVKIAIENVWNQFLLSPLEAARFVDELNSPAVGWHFDIGNVINTGWPEQWIRILGKRIQKLHFKEYSRSQRDKQGLWKGFAVDYLAGDNDWPTVMKAIDEIGYQGWAIAEPAFHPPDLSDVQFVTHVREKIDQILAL